MSKFNVIQTHSFESQNGLKPIVTVGAIVALYTSGAFAVSETDTWYVDLLTALGVILVMAGTVIGSVISIRLAPLAWDKIKPIINR